MAKTRAKKTTPKICFDDNRLEEFCRANQTWKVRLIGQALQRLMFDMEEADYE